MNVQLVMSKPVVTVEPDDTLETVNRIFAEKRFHHVVVVENKRLIGVLSDRDLFKAISPNLGKAAEKASDLATLHKKVHQVMTRKPVYLAETQNILQAITLFDEYGVSCIPVVNPQHQPVGIVSWRDLIRIIRKKI